MIPEKKISFLLDNESIKSKIVFGGVPYLSDGYNLVKVDDNRSAEEKEWTLPIS